jgi:hypothetical protein
VSGPKLPFDWKRLTDDDKQKLIDSARTAIEKSQADAKAAGASPGAAAAGAAAGAAMGGGAAGATMEIRVMSTMGAAGGGGMAIGGAGGAGGPPTNFTMPTPTIEFVPLKEIADYYPAIRNGAAKADLDGNLWILPTTSAQSKAGELVYDVVNNNGALVQRVRLPVGRSIAGFGHNGIVYLMYRDDAAKGWFLERTKINATASAPN